MDIYESRINMLSAVIMRKIDDDVECIVFEEILCVYGISFYCSDMCRFKGFEKFLELLNRQLFELYQISEKEYDNLRLKLTEVLNLTY